VQRQLRLALAQHRTETSLGWLVAVVIDVLASATKQQAHAGYGRRGTRVRGVRCFTWERDLMNAAGWWSRLIGRLHGPGSAQTGRHDVERDGRARPDWRRSRMRDTDEHTYSCVFCSTVELWKTSTAPKLC
jgi:hypothetical protein